MNVCEALRNAVKTADRAYEAHKNESYSSILYARKKEYLEQLLSKAKDCPRLELLLSELRQERLCLIQLIEKEECCPSFDWYNEHYWEMAYTGQRDGCQEAIAILEAFLSEGKTK